MKWITELVFKHRKALIAGVGIITIFFGYELTQIKVNSDIVGYLPKDDPAVVIFNKVGEVFSGNDLSLVAVESQDVFSMATVNHIKALTDKFKAIEGVSAVTSLTNILDIRKGADNSVEVAKLIDPENIPQTQAELNTIKQYALSKEIYKGRIVSADAKTTLIVCRLMSNVEKVAVTREIKKVALAAGVPEKLYFGGVPFLIYELSDAIFNDLKALIPLVCVLVILTLYASFRTIRGVVVPMLSVGISTVWTLGFMSLMKVPISMISDVIPVLLIAVGTAPCIHILSKYDEKLSRYGNTGAEVKAAFQEVGLRVILTELTIILGFTSFIFGSYLTMIREFGIFTSLGTLVVMMVSIVLVPAILSYFTVKTKWVVPQPEDPEQPHRIKGFMHTFSDFILKHEWGIIIAWMVLFVIGAFGILRIERRVDIIDYFKPGKDIRVAENILVNKFGGSQPVQIRVKGDVQNPYVLQEMSRMAKFLQALPDVSNAQSVAGLVEELNDAMNSSKTIPDTRDKITNLWFFLDGQEIMPQYVASDLSEGLIQAIVGTREMEKTKSILDHIDRYIGNLEQQAVAVELARVPISIRETLYRRQINRVVENMEWDIRQYHKTAVLDKRKVELIIWEQAVKPQLLSGQGLAIDARVLEAQLLKQLPAEVSGDKQWQEAAVNDIKQINDAIVYIPFPLYQSLGIHTAGKEPEKILFAMEYTGMPLIYQHLDNSLLSSQVESFTLALILIFILLAFQLRSLSGGLIGLIPIIITVFITFGIMGYLKIPLDVATVLVASIALGIGIDYAIHFCMRFKHYFELSGDMGLSLENTLHTTGKAIVINVISVTMGFLTLMFADLIPLKRFGLLVSITMIFSGLASISLLPALIILTRANFVGQWDKVSGKLKRMVPVKGGGKK